MSTLLIDNHDSNTYNLFQLLAVIEGSEPVVVRNDEARWAQIDVGRFDRCVISPGPGRPDEPRDFGLSRAALDQAGLPVLGVCLGHQGLALAHGGIVGPAPAPMHGRRSSIHHDSSALFREIPQGFRAVRYHSLTVHEPIPAELEVIARTRSGTVMALRHRRRPQWGVQFHPESVHTEWGERLLRNFVEMTPGRGRRPRSAHAPRHVSRRPRLELVTRTVRRPLDAESAFAGLFGSAPSAFWLDSAAEHRWSYMGAGTSLLQHRVGEQPALVERLRRALEPVPPGGPAPFTGGWVGYLGYELKAEFGATPAHRSPLPDAQLLRADRIVAYDHRDDEAHVICLCEPGERAQSAEYAEHLARRLRVGPASPLPRPPRPGRRSTFALARSPQDYLGDIAACQAHLHAGESYEICLTNELRGPRAVDALDLYRVLRSVNPAPFAAFLRLRGVDVLSSSPERFLSVDRDGRVEAKPIKGTAARGATPREDRDAAEALRRGGKDRAENLMIVDVLRNDLGRVAAIGSVEVPTLMGVETYETVHQLVSTVRARLRPGATILECLHAAFPGGSMTGAPKLRTMELIDVLEGRPRGVYSGAIGWIGASGDGDLAIAIRTIVNSASGMTIGAGGAITVQSDPQAELDELLLKARAPLEAVGLALHGDRDAATLAPPLGLRAQLARVRRAMGVTHLDEATAVDRGGGHIKGRWTLLGESAGSVIVGVRRIQVVDGSWSTPVHDHGGAEEIFFVLGGSGILLHDGRAAEIGPNDCIVCLAGAGAHSMYGTGSLDVLAFGPRPSDLSTRYPRLGLSMIGARFVESVAPEPGTTLQFTREAEVGPPELPATGQRPASIVNLADVEAVTIERPRVARTRRNLGVAAGSIATGLQHVTVLPGKAATPAHCHSLEEEIFVVLDGEGTLALDGEQTAVRAGQVVSRPAGTGVSHVFSAGEQGLTFLAYGTRERGDICYYPRSGKALLRGVGVYVRVERLDYWEGED